MNGKYAIKVRKTGKWLNLDFRSGDTVIYVDKFTGAYLFDNASEAYDFIDNNNLMHANHEMFKLNVIAEPRGWTEARVEHEYKYIIDITKQLLDEKRKHPTLDWADIAAHKIFSTGFSSSWLEATINEWKKEHLVNEDIPFHHEAEIGAGFRAFLKWVRENKGEN